MRKITLLFASLFLVMGSAWAEVTKLEDFKQDKCYTFSTTGRGGWAVKGDGSQFASTNDCGWGTTVDKTNKNQQFAVLSANGKDYYLYSVGAEKFIKADRTLVETIGDALAMTAATGDFNGRARFNFRDYADSYINLGGSNQMSVDWWATIDGGNAVLVEEAGAFDPTKALAILSATVDITYNYYIGETLYTTTTKEIGKGADYPAADAVPGYVATAGLPTGKAEQDGSFDLQCSLKEDFPFSTENYFGLTVRGGAKWLTAIGKSQSLTTTPLTIDNALFNGNKKYSWIVEGTWHEGFYFKSKTGYYMAAPAEMKEGADVALVSTKEEASKFSIDMVNGQYYIRLFGTDNNCVSDFGGGANKSLKFWASSSNYGDAGSQFVVVSTDPQDLLDAFKSEYTSSVGYVNGYDVEASVIEALTLETVGDFLDENEIIEFTAGEYYIKGANKAWYAGNSKNNFVASEATELNKDYMWSFKATEDGGYKLKSVATEKYVSALVDAVTTGSGATPIDKEADAAGTYTFTDNGAAKFIIKSEGKIMRTEGSGNINYWGSEVNEWYLVPVAKEPMTIVGAKVGEVEIVDGAAEVTSIATIDLIFDRPVAMGEGWATIAGPYGPETLGMEILEAEEGSSEYVVRFFDYYGGYTDSREYTVNIPAGIIVGADYSYFINPEFTATITIPEASEEPGEPETPSASLNVTNVTVGEDAMEGLVAVAKTTDVIVVTFDGEFYLLNDPTIVDANGNDASGKFQFMDGTNAGFGTKQYVFMAQDWNGNAAPAGTYTITMAKSSFAASAAYKAPAEDIVLTVEILGEETKIDAVEADAKAVIYDLAGRRVEKMEKGIYIVNGKKVVIK